MENKKAPVNTTKAVQEDSSGFLGAALVLGASNAIEHQEACGQNSFVNSDTLPVDIRSEREGILESWGIKFLGPVEEDEIFQYVELPEGWSKKPSDHSMWSYLVDDKGRRRASIFYKAAFYDRSAHLDVEHRYNIQKDYEKENEGLEIAHVVDGRSVIIYSTEPIVSAPPPGRDYDIQAHDKVMDLALAWLNEKFPDWQNPAAYWD